MEKSGGIRPVQRDLPFHKAFDQDHTGEFFEHHFSKLFVEIHVLVEKTFYARKADRVAARSPWLRDYPKAFHHYIDLVAHPEPFSGKWDQLLRDQHKKSILIQAIIMKALDIHVLSSLLFGASAAHAKILRSADAEYLDSEGFDRSELRSHTNRMYLKLCGGVPDLFWEEVDRLTLQLMEMLFPASTHVSEATTWVPPPIKLWYQWLHDLVAYAGWLNVCIRLFPDIIVTEWPMPGSRMEHDQENMSQELFERSEDMAKKVEGRWAKKLQASSDFHEGWMARVNIAVLPRVTLFCLARDEIGFGGIESYSVVKPHVVYYQGRFDDQEEAKYYMSQEEYIRRLKNRKAPPHEAALVIMLLATLVWWMLCTESGKRHMLEIQKAFLDLWPKPEPAVVVKPKPKWPSSAWGALG